MTNTTSESVLCPEHAVELTSNELELMQLFLRNRNRILSPERIRDALWGAGCDLDAIAPRVDQLRNKLCAHFDRNGLQSLRGVGFCYRDDYVSGVA